MAAGGSPGGCLVYTLFKNNIGNCHWQKYNPCERLSQSGLWPAERISYGPPICNDYPITTDYSRKMEKIWPWLVQPQGPRTF
jgi:hypothetical protein